MMDRIFSRGEVSAISCVLPKQKLTIESLGDRYGEHIVKKISMATGIRELCIAAEGMTASDYCMEAARNLFRQGIVSPKDIDGVVFVTTTPDYIIPNTSAIIQASLGIPTSAVAFDINYGCAGYVYGLFQAFLLAETGYCKKVLLCVGDTESKYIHPEDRALRMVIGDAGTATLVSATEGTLPAAFSFFTEGAGAEHLMIPAGGCRLPRQSGVTDILRYDRDGNGRTQENLYMNGMEVMEFALHDVKNVMDTALDIVGLSKSEIDLFALHQANAFMVKSLARQLKVDKEKVPFGAEVTGNTSCASIPTMLSQCYPGKHRELRRVLACGFGTGLSCAAGVIDLGNALVLPHATV